MLTPLPSHATNSPVLSSVTENSKKGDHETIAGFIVRAPDRISRPNDIVETDDLLCIVMDVGEKKRPTRQDYPRVLGENPMTDDHIKAMDFAFPEYIPVSVGILPAAWIKYREDLDAMLARHPVLFGNYQVGKRDYDAVGGTYVRGAHVDRWGCVWENIAHGMEAYVKGHPLPTRESVRTAKAPEILDGHFPHGFMYLRLQDLRGFEELMLDFAEEPPELQQLIDLVLDYNLRNLEVLLARSSSRLLFSATTSGCKRVSP